MPPISTDRNGNYGPPLVSQKYSPLANIQLTPADQNYCSALLTNRRNLLIAQNIFPQQPLILTAPSWPAIIAAEAGHDPPLVVISSNRAQWILSGINAANSQLASLGLATFANASDLNALTAQASQAVSPPIYCPTRIGPAPNRNVYIVVHTLEYIFYKNTLRGTGITVIGWSFRAARPFPAMGLLAGFGASRFAAIQFCKTLRTAAPGGAPPWNFAWLFDDNVVALTNFAGYVAVEAAMAPNAVCAGFQGGTSALSFIANRTWARAGLGGAAPALPPLTPGGGILQQAVLWNIAYLSSNQMNISPIFVTSGEDVSIGNYFNTQPIPYRYYGGITVRKEDPTIMDGSPGAQSVTAARNAYAAFFANAESAGPAAPPPLLPPPVQFQPQQAGDGGVQTLSNFVNNCVLPNAPAMNPLNPVKRDVARSQGVEQIACHAMGSLGNIITSLVRTQTFQLAGVNVILRNQP